MLEDAPFLEDSSGGIRVYMRFRNFQGVDVKLPSDGLPDGSAG